MTPEFTLSLSFEGIRLLRRVERGWQNVGDVALDVADLPASLAELREKGVALVGDGEFSTKLLIPDEQIRYERIETARTTLDDVHAALEGKTPYAIADLVIDYDQSGGRTHIAAVARETLAEAEAFATEHGFAPMAFVAAAEPYTFQHEVFFGPTKLTKGQVVTRDAEPVRLSEVIDAAPDEPATSLPKVLTASMAAPTLDEVKPTAPQATIEPAADVSDDTAQAVAPDVPLPETESEAPATEDDTPETAEDVVGLDDSVKTDPGTASEPEPEVEPEPEPMVMFASRKREAPVNAASDVTDPAPSVEDPEPVIEPLFTRRKEPPALAVPVGAADGPTLGSAEPTAEGPSLTPVIADEPDLPAAPVLTHAAEPDLDDGEYVPVGAVPVGAAPAATPPVAEEERMAVFGSDERKRGAPRFLALKMTAVLLLVMLLVALWANSWTEDGIAGWFKSDDPVEVAATPAVVVPEATAPAVAATPEPIEAPAPSALTPETNSTTTAEAPPLPVVRAPTGRILTPAEADRIYAATGVYQRAPRIAVELRTGTIDGLRTSAVLATPDRPARATLPASEAEYQDLPIAAPLDPPPPGTTYPRDLRGFILATPDGVVTPDGALVIAGQPPLLPPLRPGTDIVAAPDPGAVLADNGEALRLIAGPPPLSPPVRPDDLVTEVVSQAEPSADSTPTDDARVDPADDILAAVSDAVADALPDDEATTAVEEGLDVVAGTPPVTPPLRPADLNPDEARAIEPPQGDVVLVAGSPPARPPLRPESVTARAAEISAGGVNLAALRPDAREEPFADPELAGFRPSVRPAGLAPEVAEAPEEPDLSDVLAEIAEAAPPSAFVNVTQRAIPVSSRPDTRPRNFDRVVASARARIAQQQQQAQAQAQAASTQTPTAVTSTRTAPTQQVSSRPAQPTGSIPTTVARAATVDNAIRLREINLIGVYGRPNDRRALVRLSNGRFVKVEVGSSLDGGRVTAIGDSALNYVKRGRTYALQLPRG